MEPINYILDVRSPIEQAMKGFALGRQDIEQNQVMQEREQIMGIRGAQEARAAAQEKERLAAAASEREKADALQVAMVRLRNMGIDGTLTTDAINQTLLTFADTFEEFTVAAENIAKPVREATALFGSQVSISLLRGRPEAAVARLDERIAAAEAEGSAQSLEEAKRLTIIRDEALIDPQGAAVGMLAGLRAQGLIDDSTMDSILESAGQGKGETPAKVDELKFRAKEAGLVPGTPEYNEFMLRGGEVEKGPLVQNIVGAGETEFEKKSGADAASQFSAIVGQGTTASRQLVELENLETLLSNVETGGTAAIKDYLGSLGIATENLGDIQAVTAAINRLIPQQRPEGSGEMSDGDVKMFARSVPALINQPGGNQIIVETLRAINEYDVAASIIAGQALDGEITRKEARKRLRELPNPLANFRAPTGTAKPGATPVIIDGVIIQEIK